MKEESEPEGKIRLHKQSIQQFLNHSNKKEVKNASIFMQDDGE